MDFDDDILFLTYNLWDKKKKENWGEKNTNIAKGVRRRKSLKDSNPRGLE